MTCFPAHKRDVIRISDISFIILPLINLHYIIWDGLFLGTRARFIVGRCCVNWDEEKRPGALWRVTLPLRLDRCSYRTKLEPVSPGPNLKLQPSTPHPHTRIPISFPFRFQHARVRTNPNLCRWSSQMYLRLINVCECKSTQWVSLIDGSWNTRGLTAPLAFFRQLQISKTQVLLVTTLDCSPRHNPLT